MTLPKRFLDEQSDADDFERAVLRAESDAGPPAGTEREVFARVMAAALPLAPAASGPAAPVEPVVGGALAVTTERGSGHSELDGINHPLTPLHSLLYKLHNEQYNNDI